MPLIGFVGKRFWGHTSISWKLWMHKKEHFQTLFRKWKLFDLPMSISLYLNSIEIQKSTKLKPPLRISVKKAVWFFLCHICSPKLFQLFSLVFRRGSSGLRHPVDISFATTVLNFSNCSLVFRRGSSGLRHPPEEALSLPAGEADLPLQVSLRLQPGWRHRCKFQGI